MSDEEPHIIVIASRGYGKMAISEKMAEEYEKMGYTIIRPEPMTMEEFNKKFGVSPLTTYLNMLYRIRQRAGAMGR